MEVASHLIHQQHENEAEHQRDADDGVLLRHVVMLVVIMLVVMIMIGACPNIRCHGCRPIRSLLDQLHCCFLRSMMVSMAWGKGAAFLVYNFFIICSFNLSTTITEVLLRKKKKKCWFRVTRPTLFFPADPKTFYSFLGREKKEEKKRHILRTLLRLKGSNRH